jgi:ankyrin repeat protein
MYVNKKKHVMSDHDFFATDYIDKLLAFEVSRGNVSEISSLLERGAYVNALRWRDIPEFPTPQYRNIKEADFGGINPNSRYGRVIQDAYEHRHRDTMEILLDAGAEIRLDYHDNDGPRGDYETSIVLHAAAQGDLAMLSFFIRNGVDLNTHRSLEYGIRPLHAVCESRESDFNTSDMIDTLVKLGVNVDAQSGRSDNKLVNLRICLMDITKIVRLMQHEVDINVFEGSEVEHYSILTSAMIYGGQEVVEAILEYNVDLDFHDLGNPEPWLLLERPERMIPVERKRHEQSVVYLKGLEPGGLALAYINNVDRWGKTALHRAAENGQFQQVRILLDRGALYNIRDKWGRRPHESAWNRCKKYQEKLSENARFSHHPDIPYRFQRSAELTQEKIASLIQISNYIRRFPHMLGSPPPPFTSSGA